MDIPKFCEKLKFKILSNSMVRLGLDPDEVDDKEGAVNAIYQKFTDEKLEIEYECDLCGGDLPDVSTCPFCGAILEDEPEIDLVNKSKGIPGELYRGARRGRLSKNEMRVTGAKLLNRIIDVSGIGKEYIKYKKTVISFWCHWGMFARCFPGAFSVRIHLPFNSGQYNDPHGIVIDVDVPIKNMKSRLAIESLDEVSEVVDILKQTVILKKELAERG